MNKIMSIIEDVLSPPMAKLSQNIYIKAIRNGMVVIIPLVIVGSFFLITLNIPIPGYAEFIEPYSSTLVLPFRVTVFMMAIYATFGIGSALGVERKLDSTTSGILALVAFMMTIVPEFGALAVGEAEAITGWYMPFTYIGSAGIFGSIVISIASVEIFYFMKKKNMTIKMPEQVPAAVSDSFAALFPTFIVVFLFWGITSVLGFNIHYFFNVILSPFQDFLAGNNLLGALITVFLITLLWSAGIHGVSVIGAILRPFWQIGLEQNMEAIAAGVPAVELANVVVEPFYQWFVWIGGSGATAGLIIAGLMIAKSEQLKTITRLSLVPSIFNINEPVIFGFPIVMNPALMIPFMAAPLVVTVISYITINIGLVNAPYILAPWTLPGPIGAVMATADWRAGILVIINIIIITVIYLPFVKIYDKQLLKQEGK